MSREIWREDDHLVVRSAANPGHWWGNFLVFDEPPRTGDRPRWETAFHAAFSDTPGIVHRAFTWDRHDGEPPAVGDIAEFRAHGYGAETTVGCVAAAAELRAHPRASSSVQVRALSPAGDDDLWEASAELQIADFDPAQTTLETWTSYVRTHQEQLRELFAAGRGDWYVALDPADGSLTGVCGVVATGPRGRFQSVHTAAARRGEGIASRLVTEAASDAAARHALDQLVIVADGDYHALGIYESLGFRRADRICRLGIDRAAAPPALA